MSFYNNKSFTNNINQSEFIQDYWINVKKSSALQTDDLKKVIQTIPVNLLFESYGMLQVNPLSIDANFSKIY